MRSVFTTNSIFTNSQFAPCFSLSPTTHSSTALGYVLFELQSPCFASPTST